MHQTVDAAFQTDEHAEVGDGLDRALNFIALLVVEREVVPRIGLALLHAQRDTAASFVDLEDHDFNFVAQRYNLGRMHVLVGPVHFGNVYQTFDTLFDLNERTVVGQVGHLAEQACALRVATCQTIPRIVAHLLDAQGNAILLLVELQYLGFNFVANRQHFGRVLHATPCQVGDVQQAVDTAQVNECTVVGDVLDDTLDDCAFFQVFQQGLAVGTLRCFQHSAAGNHHVVALAIQLDDLQLHRLVFVWCGVLDRTCIHQRTGQECTDAVHHGSQTALDLAADITFNDTAFFHCLFQIDPGSQAFSLLARQARFAVTVFQGFDGDSDEITGLNFDCARCVFEFFNGNKTFGLQSGINHNHVLLDANDLGRNQFTCAHFFAVQALFKH